MNITSLFIITFFFNASYILTAKKVAIIGAGTAGAMSAYYLNELIPDIEIHIYQHVPQEVDPYARLSVHSYNQYVKEMIEMIQLEMIPLPPYPTRAKAVVYDAIFNRPLHVNRFFKYEKEVLKPICDEFTKKFQKIYQLQSKERTFKTVIELLQSIHREFPGYTKTSIEEYLKSKISQTEDLNKVKNLVKAMMLFGPPIGLDANAFYGLMMISFTEITGKVQVSNDGTNKKFNSDLINHSKADMIFREVVKITREDSGYYQITSKAKDPPKPLSGYDIIIIATNKAKNIVFDLDQMQNPKLIQYANIYAHGVKGMLDKSVVGEQSEASQRIPSLLDVDKTRLIVKVPGGKPVDYYVIANNKLSRDEVAEYFHPLNELPESEQGTIQHSPKYSDYNLLDDAHFVLTENLYNVKAIESAVPLLEMMAISAQNIAFLIKNKTAGQRSAGRKRADKGKSVISSSKSLKIGKSKSSVRSGPY